MWRRVLWVAAIVVIVAALAWTEIAHRVSWNSVMEISLKGSIHSQSSAPAPSDSGRAEVSIQDLIRAVDAARNDKRIVGLVVRIGSGESAWSEFQELAPHIESFRNSRKLSICAVSENYSDDREDEVESLCDETLGPNARPDDVDDLLDERLGDDNWISLGLAVYLKEIRHQ